MSIMIKNLDMPIGCQKCKFFCKHMFGNGLDYSYSCILGAKEFHFPWIKQLDNRAVDCPIVEADKESEEISREEIAALLARGSEETCDGCYSEHMSRVIKDLYDSLENKEQK